MRLLAVLFLTMLCSTVAVSGRAAPRPRPNIILLIADDIGNADLGYRTSLIDTPNLDALAAESVRLEHFYAHPFCMPTRAALHTGEDPADWVFRIPADNAPRGPSIPNEILTLPERFASAGYATALIGKWHLGSTPEGAPRHHGYQYTYGLVGGLIDYWTHRWNDRLDWHRNGVPLEETGYATTLIGRDAARWIKDREADKPFFLNVSFNAPHFPIHSVPETLAKYRASGKCTVRCSYMAMIDSLDQAVGAIVAALESRKIRSHTLIVFFSDNGGVPILGSSNAPYRGGKATLLEGGVRVPAFMNWPGVIKPGENHQRGRVSDLYATLEEAAGLERRAPLQGRSLWSSIATGTTTKREPFFWRSWPNQAAGTNAPCATCSPPSRRRIRAMLNDEWKLLVEERYNNRGHIEKSTITTQLYKIKSDPLESTDLAADYPERVAAMLSALDCWERTDCEIADTSSQPTDL